MKIALVGTGQMGQAVEALANDRGHDIVARFDIDNPLTEQEDKSALKGAQVVIDFSLPEAAVDNIRRYCDWDVHAVVGTTGWYDRLDEVSAAVEGSDAAVLYAPNFSLGVALLVRALRGATGLLEQLPEYDVYVHEVHHTRKVDSPSGTAGMLGQLLVDRLSRKERIETETQHERIPEEALHVSSTRAGSVFGEHTVGLDSPFDQIRLVHEAKNRRGFAFGAVRAAEWIPGRRGLFTLEDVLADWIDE